MTHLQPSGSFLAGDVGGTKTTLALYDGDDIRAPRDVRTYNSRSLSGLEGALVDFLAGRPCPPAAAFAVAGPVISGTAQITNLPWSVFARALKSQFGFGRLDLVNDVEALASAIPSLRPAELSPLQRGEADARGTLAVLALGTGLGMGYVTSPQHAHASEGGHADFAPTSPLQARLLASLWHEFDHVSAERVASGLGLPRIHRFLVAEEGWKEDSTVAEAIAAAADPTPIIVAAAQSGGSPASQEAAAILCDIVAAEAGNLALKLLATGGVFLGGGLAPRLLPFLRAPRFAAAFRAKGRFEMLLARIPVHVVLSSEAVLWGAALRALRAPEDPT